MKKSISLIFNFLNDNIIHNLRCVIGIRSFYFINLIFFVIVINKKNINLFKINKRSDYITLKEIFVGECYKFSHLKIKSNINNSYSNILNNRKTPLILDCGSNNGASSIYFTIVYDEAKIVSIEPDEDNFKSLRRNIKKYKKKIVCYNSAIANDNYPFDVKKKDNDLRSSTVISSIDSKKNTMTVKDVIKDFSSKKYSPFLIKIDIEGGEENLFNNNTEWINNFEVIIIELHDQDFPEKTVSKNFFKSQIFYNRKFFILNENILSIKE